MNRYFSIFTVLIFILNCAGSQVESGKKKPLVPTSVKPGKLTPADRLRKAEKKMYSATDPEERKSAMYEAARLNLEQGNAGKAVALFNKLLKSGKSERLPHVDHYLGQAYYENSDYRAAIIHFSKSARKNPDFRKHQRIKMVVKSHYESGQYGLALGLLGKATRQGMEKDLFYYKTASSCFYRIRDKRRSKSLALEGLKKYPGNPSLQKILQMTPDGT